MADEHGTRNTMRAHLQEAVSDWLNPLSLGSMSAFGYIENFSFNVTPKVCGVAACIFQQRGHALAIHRVCFILVVAFRTTVI